MSKPDGGPAFPFTSKWVSKDGETTGPHLGMSLRDYAEIHFTAAWIPVLSERYGNQDHGQVITEYEAGVQGKAQAEAMLKAQAE